MEVGAGFRLLKNTLDEYELGYYDYCEILRYVLVCVDIGFSKDDEITENFIKKACEDGIL